MRKTKLAICAAVVGVLAVAAIAYAQQVNTYTVTGSTSPTNSGSKKKPVPVSVKFNYVVGEATNQRPSPVKKYSIKFGGLNVNTEPFDGCSTAQLEEGGIEACKAGSIMGTGYIENESGARDNPADKSIACNAKLWVVNSKKNKANIYVKGGPNATDPREKCAIELAAPIPAQFVRSSSGTALEFTVPPSLLHPLPTLDNAVKRVQSTIKKATKTVKGRKVGFFESIGGCTRGKREITVTFTPESGGSKRAQVLANCKK